jgi:hypothetical protein
MVWFPCRSILMIFDLGDKLAGDERIQDGRLYVTFQLQPRPSEAKAYAVSVPNLPCTPLSLDDESSFVETLVLKKKANLAEWLIGFPSWSLSCRLELPFTPAALVSLKTLAYSA